MASETNFSQWTKGLITLHFQPLSILQEAKGRVKQKGFFSKLWRGGQSYCCQGYEVEEGQTLEQRGERSEEDISAFGTHP